MKLRTDEEGVFFDFDRFHQQAVRRSAGDDEAGLAQALAVGVVEFVAVAVALADFGAAVGAAAEGPVGQVARPGAEPHGGAELFLFHQAFLLGHDVDDRLRRLGVDFRGVGALHSGDVPREFYHRELHPVTQPEERLAMFAAPADSRDLALDAARTETARHDDAVVFRQFAHGFGVFFVLFGVQPLDDGLAAGRPDGMLDRLDDRDVGIGQRETAGGEIFAHDADTDLALGAVDAAYESAPVFQVFAPRLES